MRILVILSLVVMISCSPKMAADQNTAASNETSSEILAYREQAYKVLKVSPVEFQENKTGEYVLATYLDKSQVPGADPLRVAVLKTATSEVVFKQNLSKGSAKWLGDFTIQIIAPPGMPNGNQATVADYTYTIDVRTGKKTSAVNVEVKE